LGNVSSVTGTTENLVYFCEFDWLILYNKLKYKNVCVCYEREKESVSGDQETCKIQKGNITQEPQGTQPNAWKHTFEEVTSIQLLRPLVVEGSMTRMPKMLAQS
jgi:hypothetical protein